MAWEDSNNKMLTRIYGAAALTKDQLAEHLRILEERKERYHKKIGRELELFTFNPLVGQGLPIWLPNGMKVRQQMERYITELEEDYGYQHIATPVMGLVIYIVHLDTGHIIKKICLFQWKWTMKN